MLSRLKKYSKILSLLVLLYCALSSFAKNKEFPTIWNLSNSNEYFVGRKNILNKIHHNFKQGKNNITILGSSGIGKTQVAKRYSQLHKQDYDIIWWIDSDRNKNIDEQFKRLAEEWNNLTSKQEKKIKLMLPAEEIVKQLKMKLRTTNMNWLLVFDNATDMDRIKLYVPEKHNSKGYGHILITSKNPFEWSNMLELEKFSRNESIELISKVTGRNDLTDSNYLAETLRDFPLALVQASAYLKSNPSVSTREYANLFLTNRDRLWKEESKTVTKHAAFDNYEFTVFTTMSLIIDEIKGEFPDSVSLLAFISYLGKKDIPKSLLQQYLSDIGVSDKLKQEEIISKLLEYSLIQLHEVKDNYRDENLPDHYLDGLKKRFIIHKITQLAIMDYFDEAQKRYYLGQSVKSMANFIPDKLTVSIPLIQDTNILLPHINSLVFNAEKQNLYSNALLVLRIRELEYFLSGRRNFVYSEELIEKINNELEKTKIEKITLIRFYLMKAVYHAWKNFDYKQGIVETEKALKLLGEINGNYFEEYLMAYNRMMQFYGFMGDRPSALKFMPLGEEVIKKSTGYLGNQDAFYHSLAKIHMDDEQFDKAYSYSLKSIEYKAEVSGKLIIGNLPLHILASEILIRNNKINDADKEASRLYKEVKEIMKDSDDIYMSAITVLYGYTSFLRKPDDKANITASINLITSGQKMLKRIVGNKYNKNRNAALSHVFLGSIYEKSKNNMKALIEYNQAEKILNNFYGYCNLKSSDASDLYAKMAMLYMNLGDQETAQKYLTKLQKVFGYKNAKTALVTDYFLEKGLSVGY